MYKFSISKQHQHVQPQWLDIDRPNELENTVTHESPQRTLRTSIIQRKTYTKHNITHNTERIDSRAQWAKQTAKYSSK